MPDLRKAVRLAGELAAELKLQGQMDGELGDTLDQFLGESDELIELADATTEDGVRGHVPLISGEIVEDLARALYEEMSASPLGAWPPAPGRSLGTDYAEAYRALARRFLAPLAGRMREDLRNAYMDGFRAQRKHPSASGDAQEALADAYVASKELEG